MCAIGKSFPHDPETVGDRASGHTRGAKRARVRSGEPSQTIILAQSFLFVCSSHIVNLRKMFPFISTSHTFFMWKHLCKVPNANICSGGRRVWLFIDPTRLLSRNYVRCLRSSPMVLSEKPSAIQKPNKQTNWPIIDNVFSNQIDISYQTHHMFHSRITTTRIS